MKLLLLGIALLTALSLVLYLWGRTIPREHSSQVRLQLPVPPSQVMALLTDFANHATWRTYIKSIAVSGPTITEQTSFGPISYVVQEQSDTRLVTRILADPATADFGGTWTFSLAPSPGGSTLTITEDGFVNPPIMRIFSRYIFGQDSNLRQYATALEKRLDTR